MEIETVKTGTQKEDCKLRLACDEYLKSDRLFYFRVLICINAHDKAVDELIKSSRMHKCLAEPNVGSEKTVQILTMLTQAFDSSRIPDHKNQIMTRKLSPK